MVTTLHPELGQARLDVVELAKLLKPLRLLGSLVRVPSIVWNVTLPELTGPVTLVQRKENWKAAVPETAVATGAW
jgi:hypothetical protein